MNGKYRAVAVVALVMVLMENPVLLAWGNPPPGRWEKVGETEPGQKMVIYTNDGAKNRYRFRSLDSQFLNCINEYGGEVQIGLATIKEIVIPKAEKYAANGALVGAAGGGIIGGVLAVKGGDLTTAGYFLVAAVGAGIGALGGSLAGAAVGGPGETVYISKEAALNK